MPPLEARLIVLCALGFGVGGLGLVGRGLYFRGRGLRSAVRGSAWGVSRPSGPGCPSLTAMWAHLGASGYVGPSWGYVGPVRPSSG